MNYFKVTCALVFALLIVLVSESNFILSNEYRIHTINH